MFNKGMTSNEVLASVANDVENNTFPLGRKPSNNYELEKLHQALNIKTAILYIKTAVLLDCPKYKNLTDQYKEPSEYIR